MRNNKSLKNKNVINSIIITAIITIISLFFFIPYITEKYTIKTIIKNSKTSVDQIKLTRAYYVDSIVSDIKVFAPNIKFHYEHEGINGKIPLPTTTIHDLSKIFSENTGIKYNLYSEFPFENRKDRILTKFQKDAIKYTKKNPEGLYVKKDNIEGEEVLRVATTDFMTSKACVECHNNHHNRTWERDHWKIGDKRGVIEVITPIEEELVAHKKMRNYIVLIVALTFIIVLSYLSIKIKKREKELLEAADELELEVYDKNKELKTLEGLLDKYVISSKTDLKGHITYVSKAFTKISGYNKKELINTNHNILRHPDMEKETFRQLWDTIKKGKVWRGEILNKKKNGGSYWVEAVISPDVNEKGEIIGYNAVRNDITSQKEAKFLAFHDYLTGLPNKAKFEEIANHAIKVAKRDKTKLAIFFIDFDNFKNINDTLGHAVGDEMLKAVAKRMQSTLREVDTVARIGGDEFVILLESMKDSKDISNIATKILDIVSKPIHTGKNTLNTSASIGISIYPDDSRNLIDLMKNADSAMYLAKEKGKNNHKFFTEELNKTISRKHHVENAINRAIKNESFSLVFQPKYNLKTFSCSSCEVLLRLEDEELGVISPAEFIPIAEENRAIVKIGDIVFRKACEVLSNWKKINLGIDVIAINISSIQLEQNININYFENIVKEYGLSPKNIELEITEHSIIENLEENIKVLQKLRSLGFEIAIDDFGTGYSSMNYLKELPVDTIKIDKSFVDDILSNQKALAVAKAIIQLCKDLEHKVIAEGIEEKTQEVILKELGCHFGQGYLFSKGLKNEEFISFIKNLNK